MRLLLDEQYSHQIARELRSEGFDVVAVVERPELLGADDDALLRSATAERRALLTNNVRHYAPLARVWARSGEGHYGLVFTSDASMPRSRETIGTYLAKLRALLRAHPCDGALRDRALWLA